MPPGAGGSGTPAHREVKAHFVQGTNSECTNVLHVQLGNIEKKAILTVAVVPLPEAVSAKLLPPEGGFEIPGLPLATVVSPPGGVWDFPIPNFFFYRRNDQNSPSGWRAVISLSQSIQAQPVSDSRKQPRAELIKVDDLETGLYALASELDADRFSRLKAYKFKPITNSSAGVFFHIPKGALLASKEVRFDPKLSHNK